MFLFIGGPARCGKTTLAKQAEQHYQGQSLSLDSLRQSYIALASPEQRALLDPNAKIQSHSVGEWLEVLRARDYALWVGVKAYITSATLLQDNVLLEGCLWPDYLREIHGPYRAVFLVDTSSDHSERIIAGARSEKTHNNWMKNRSEAWLTKWATYNIERSKLYVQIAHTCRQPVFDIAEMGYDHAQKAALDYLFHL